VDIPSLPPWRHHLEAEAESHPRSYAGRCARCLGLRKKVNKDANIRTQEFSLKIQSVSSFANNIPKKARQKGADSVVKKKTSARMLGRSLLRSRRALGAAVRTVSLFRAEPARLAPLCAELDFCRTPGAGDARPLAPPPPPLRCAATPEAAEPLTPLLCFGSISLGGASADALSRPMHEARSPDRGPRCRRGRSCALRDALPGAAPTAFARAARRQGEKGMADVPAERAQAQADARLPTVRRAHAPHAGRNCSRHTCVYAAAAAASPGWERAPDSPMGSDAPPLPAPPRHSRMSTRAGRNTLSRRRRKGRWQIAVT